MLKQEERRCGLPTTTPRSLKLVRRPPMLQEPVRPVIYRTYISADEFSAAGAAPRRSVRDVLVDWANTSLNVVKSE